MITCSRNLTLGKTFGLVMRTTFKLQETLTDKTCVSGGTLHPHQIHESTLHAQKVLVWCAVSAQGLIGPFMFEDYVTGENCAIMLDSSFLPSTETETMFSSCTVVPTGWN